MENFDDYLQKKLRDPEMRHMFDTESASLDRVVKAPKIEGDEYDVEYMSPNPDHTTHCVCRRGRGVWWPVGWVLLHGSQVPRQGGR